MQFIDEAKILVKAGDGGNGCINFHHEKFVPKGGPDGGNGGDGGDVILRSSRHINTLLDFKFKRHFHAQNGENGRGKNQNGKNGEDLIIEVPCGTVVRDVHRNKILGDLTNHGDELIIARGGKGGRGNAEFATPTNQAPRYAEPGTKGEEREIILELKLLADVGLVGFPNAGKSTLISVISSAKPKIADYPFTTLVPNLGVVRYGEGKSFVVADIPGLIEGAHNGKGLGIQFLRHIERTRILLFLIDALSENPKREYEILINELHSYKSTLPRKKKIVAITKIDTADSARREELKKIKFGRGIPTRLISSVSGEGIQELLDTLWKSLMELKR